MATSFEQRTNGSPTSSPSFSPRSGPNSDTVPGSSLEPTKPIEDSSIRYRAQELTVPFEMPDQVRPDALDEITPIRHTDEHSRPSYSATEERVNTGNPSAKPAPPSNAVAETEEKQTWFKQLAEKYGSVSLENKGSVARDHLALERTFLAWLRTSLAFASIGIAITQLFRLNASISSGRSDPSLASSQSSSLPLSPLIGHGLPPDLIPLLQQLAHSAASSLPTPTAQTLLDQLLPALVPESDMAWNPALGALEFDKDAAGRLRRVGKPLGATFIGISIVVLLVGFHRYFEAQFWIMRGKFPASRGSIALVGFIAGALIIASLVIVLVVAPITYERRR